jgi:hypothetical protein
MTPQADMTPSIVFLLRMNPELNQLRQKALLAAESSCVLDLHQRLLHIQSAT